MPTMRRARIIVPLLLLLGLLAACQKKFEVRIASPKDGSTVSEQPAVAGTVTDARASVWVLVHPLEKDVSSEYWVQPEAELKPDGTWTAEVYVGDPGKEDIGKQFLVMAVANPEQTLQSGDVLKSWPPAAAQSNIVTVTRK
jgi:hypothetical protein